MSNILANMSLEDDTIMQLNINNGKVSIVPAKNQEELKLKFKLLLKKNIKKFEERIINSV